MVRILDSRPGRHVELPGWTPVRVVRHGVGRSRGRDRHVRQARCPLPDALPALDDQIPVSVGTAVRLVGQHAMQLRHGQDLRPSELLGRPLSNTGVRNRYGITVVALKRSGEDFTYATQDTVVQAGDLLIVSGWIDAVEAFADRS